MIISNLNVRLFLTVSLTLVLTILPLPAAMAPFRPPWMLLLVLYIQFFLPHYFNVTLIFFLGLCLDVLLSTTLGEHSVALLLTTWFASGRARRFSFFSLVQQIFLITLFCLMYQLIIFFIEAFLGYHSGLLTVFYASLIGMFFWPWFRILADGVLN